MLRCIAGVGLILVSTTACDLATGTVTFRVLLPGTSQVSPDRLLAVPFDPQWLLDSLAAASSEPKPDFQALEAELFAYRPRDPEAVDALRTAWEAHRVPLAALADTLRAVDRTAPGYDPLYERFRQAYAESIRREAQFERDLRRLLSGDEDLARRAAAAADSLRRWEARAYGTIDSIVDARAKAGGRLVTLLGPDSMVGVSLSRGPWWVIGRAPHPGNPYLEYYWSVPFVVGLAPAVIVPITWHNSSVRWRH